jgi:hypothetical protein
MRVRVKTRARGKYNFDPGDEIEVTDELGSALLKSRAAEKVEAPTPVKREKAAPESAAIEPREETESMPPPRRRRRSNAQVSES